MHFARIALPIAPTMALACTAAPTPPMVPIAERPVEPPNADIAELEISADGVDRFSSCPPPGELGHGWIPKLPPWIAPPAKNEPPLPGEMPLILPSPDDRRTPTERAIADTLRDFRDCYRKGLVRDPTQDGHVAVVVRVGPEGRVAEVEDYGACEISSASIACMKAAAAKLRFERPPGGSDTIIIPAVFTSRDGVRRAEPTPNDVYTASAYLTIE